MLEWIKDPANIAAIFVVWAALIGLAQTIVRLTPTDKDDRIISKLGTITEKLRNLLTLQAAGSVTKDQSR